MNNILIIEKHQQPVARAVLNKDGKLTLEQADRQYTADVETLVGKINTEGPELRQCREDKEGRIIEALIFVKPTEQNYGYAIEDEFTRAGFQAKLLDDARAELWEKVRASDTDLAFQETVLRNITLLKDELIYDITKEFETYEKSV